MPKKYDIKNAEEGKTFQIGNKKLVVGSNGKAFFDHSKKVF
jgi:hypothetical protein